MSREWVRLFAVLVAGVLGTAFFAGAEIGLISLDPLAIRSREAAPGRRRLMRLLTRRRGIIITSIIANNIFLVGTSVILTGLAERRWGEAATLPVTAILALVVFAFGEVLPKALFRRRPEPLMAMATVPILVAHLVLRPVSALAILVTAAMNPRRDEPGGARRRVTRDELRGLFAESSEAETSGVDARMIARIFRMRTTTARQVMIPLERVVMLPESATSADVLDTIRRGGPTRLPLFDRSRTRIIGLVNVFDVLYDETPAAHAAHYLRNVEFVERSRRVDELLVALRRTRSGMAVVVDPDGRALGIVTIEDLVEEIVGELADEHEVPARPAPALGTGTGGFSAG